MSSEGTDSGRTSLGTTKSANLEAHIKQIRVRHAATAEEILELDEHIEAIHDMAKAVVLDSTPIYWLSLVKHLLLFIPFLGIGGVVLSKIERPGEEAAVQYRKQASRDLHNLLTGLNAQGILNLSDVEQAENLCDLDLEPFDGRALDWSWAGGAYLIAQVVTTVGYGTFAPLTIAGRMVVCFYAIFGIGWFGYILILLSERHHAVMQWFVIYKLDERRWLPYWIRKQSTSSKVFALLSLMVLLYLTSIGCAAVGSHLYANVCLDGSNDCEEHSTFIDAIYFALVSFTTVGLGDMAPPFWSHERPKWQIMAFWTTWSFVLLIGLSLLSMLVGEIDILVREKAWRASMGVALKAWQSVDHHFVKIDVSSTLHPHLHLPHNPLPSMKKKLKDGISNLSSHSKDFARSSSEGMRTRFRPKIPMLRFGADSKIVKSASGHSVSAGGVDCEQELTDDCPDVPQEPFPVNSGILSASVPHDEEMPVSHIIRHSVHVSPSTFFDSPASPPLRFFGAPARLSERQRRDEEKRMRDEEKDEESESIGGKSIGGKSIGGESIGGKSIEVKSTGGKSIGGESAGGKSSGGEDRLQYLITLLENSNEQRWSRNRIEALELCKEEAARQEDSEGSPRNADADAFLMKLLQSLLK